ncbi:lipase 3-like [Euwallacea fornicatus]|uniref:lipase 3-like n=1 Tax=Euwallacea fornicatus TaxID=995702 RepID=UPI00338DF59B
MQSSLVVLTILLVCLSGSVKAKIWLHPDTGLNLYQFIAKYGYYYENYTVETKDNYILNTVRIPRARNENGNSTSKKPAVLLLHGIWSNPQDFIIKGDSSLGFLLAEQGFDVFLMASRGNTYSTGHLTLSTDSVKYWNFSFHEIGYYDIPANIDLISNLNGNSNISFIGHSQGGTAFVSLAATRPEYRARISVAHLFAPVVYMDYSRLPLFSALKSVHEDLENLLTSLQLNKGILTYSPLVLPLAIMFCNVNVSTVHACVDLLGLVGPNPNQLDPAMLTVMATNNPAGGSFKQVFHYLQVAKSSKFKLYDYRSDNTLMYSTSQAPFYNLSSIDDIPIYIWYGINDYFSGVLDFKRLIREIPSAISKVVTSPLWNHIDFVFANKGKFYVYDEVINILKDTYDI